MNAGGRFAPLTVLSKTWRLLMATTAFAIFGVCGVLFGYIVFPLLHVIADSDRAERWCRRTLQLGFRTFVSFLTFVGLLRCTLRGNTEPLTWRGVLIVANHPSLIDVIVLVSYLPDAICVVKEGVWHNPFYGRAVRAAGYIPRRQANEVVDQMASLILAGETVLLFPEGTRTPVGKKPLVRRGASLALVRANRPAVPVRLEIFPSVLGKGYGLLHLPAQRIQYSLTVGSVVKPTDFVGAGSERAQAREGARLLTMALGGQK